MQHVQAVPRQVGLNRLDLVREAMLSLDPSKQVDEVYCDINGERYRTEEWGFALLRTADRMGTTAYTTAVGEWGDVGAASGALLMILAVQAWQRGYARGESSLVWSSSDGGLRAATVLQRSPSV